MLTGLYELGRTGMMGCAGFVVLSAAITLGSRSERYEKVLPLVGFCILYPAILITLGFSIRFDAIGERLLAPCLIAVVPLSAWLIERLYQLDPKWRVPLIASLLAGLSTIPLSEVIYLKRINTDLAEARIARKPIVQWMRVAVRPNDVVIGDVPLSAFCPGYVLASYPEFPRVSEARVMELAARRVELKLGDFYWIRPDKPSIPAERVKHHRLDQSEFKVWKLSFDGEDST